MQQRFVYLKREEINNQLWNIKLKLFELKAIGSFNKECIQFQRSAPNTLNYNFIRELSITR